MTEPAGPPWLRVRGKRAQVSRPERHWREREAGIIDCLRAGVGRIDAIVERLYIGLQPGLHRAAGRSVHAHLIDLVGRGVVESDGPPSIDASYRLART